MLTCLVAALAVTSLPQSQAPFKFAVYGDDRDGHTVHRKIVAMIAAEKPALVFNTGDLVRAGSAADLWKIFDDITSSLRKKTDYYAVRGNHDLGDALFTARFSEPEKSSKEGFFSFDRAGCHFVALDVAGETSYKPGSKQYEWLQKDLQENARTVKHTFVFFHIPPFSIGAHGPDLEVRKALCPLFEKYKVDVVFNGHDHIYYRTRRNGVNYVVTGGGGAPLYDTDPKKGAVKGDKWKKVNHFLVVEVRGSKVTMRALRTDGTVVETVDLTAAKAQPGQTLLLK